MGEVRRGSARFGRSGAVNAAPDRNSKGIIPYIPSMNEPRIIALDEDKNVLEMPCMLEDFYANIDAMAFAKDRDNVVSFYYSWWHHNSDLFPEVEYVTQRIFRN